MSQIGIKIKQLRIDKGMTQAQLARRLLISRSLICSYENGSRNPSYSVLIKLAVTFDVTTDYLLGNESKNTYDISRLSNEQKKAVSDLLKVLS